MVKNEILDVSDGYHQWFIWGPGLATTKIYDSELDRLDQVTEESVPKDFDPNKSIGIPIG